MSDENAQILSEVDENTKMLEEIADDDEIIDKLAALVYQEIETIEMGEMAPPTSVVQPMQLEIMDLTFRVGAMRRFILTDTEELLSDVLKELETNLQKTLYLLTKLHPDRVKEMDNEFVRVTAWLSDNLGSW